MELNSLLDTLLAEAEGLNEGIKTHVEQLVALEQLERRDNKTNYTTLYRKIVDDLLSKVDARSSVQEQYNSMLRADWERLKHKYE